MKINTATVIIRSIGERTEELCYRLLASQICEQNIHVVRTSPFAKALMKSYIIGIESKKDWTIAIDADVLIRDSAIEDLLSWATYSDSDYFLSESTVADKFLGKVRTGGVKLYQTRFLEKAISFFDGTMISSLRPETHVRNQMALAGFPSIKIYNLILGLHDFEQFYKDIYRTAYTHQKKHTSITDALESYWNSQRGSDPDFKVASLAFEIARSEGKDITIDQSLFPKTIQEIKGLSHLQEKEPIELGIWTNKEVTYRLGCFSPYNSFTESSVIDKEALCHRKNKAKSGGRRRFTKYYRNFLHVLTKSKK